MPTSPKRIKKRRKIRFPVVILGICLVAAIAILTGFALKGCSKPNTGSPESSEPSPAVSSAAQADGSYEAYSAYLLHKMCVSEDAVLYVKGDGGFEPAGSFPAGVLLDIGSEQEGQFLPINDSPFYIDGSSLTATDRWYRSDTNLLPFNENLITADSYHLLDESGAVLAEVNRSDAYPVYVKPGDDQRCGVKFMNGIAYISVSEVSDIQQVNQTAQAQAEEIPVLMYHFFYSEAEGGSRIDGNYVEVNELDEQLNYIKENGFHACTMREVQYWMEGRGLLPYHSIAITIDDADPSVHQYAMPVFVKYGLHATNFVICGWQPPEMPYELWEMRENGMELQSHGFLTHTGGCSGMGHGGILLCMDHDAGVEDTVRSFEYVDGGFVYCYPFGDINDNAESIVRDAGAKLAFTTEGGRINPTMDPLALPRVRVTGGNGLSAFAASIG